MAKASENAGVKLYIDDKAISEIIYAEQGEDWSTYTTVTAKTSEISAGEHALKMEIVGNYVNVDWLEFCKESCKTTGLVHRVELGVQGLHHYRVYSLNGAFVGSVAARNANEARAKIRTMVFEKGVYLMRSQNGSISRFMVTR